MGFRLLRKVIRQIVEGVHPRKIILFGSYASGKPHEDSDVDLLIVMPSRKRPVERAVDVSKVLRFHPFPMDILVRTPQELERRLRLGDIFFRDIVTKGKLLYES
ncbi:MAG: nucleotidyltransferase domain-containing protein [Candidatus Omnitrophica bacterium]|nr:nucleotidyltransferase domain-containing protein [Candidatus Omnitrophota bacterium]